MLFNLVFLFQVQDLMVVLTLTLAILCFKYLLILLDQDAISQLFDYSNYIIVSSWLKHTASHCVQFLLIIVIFVLLKTFIYSFAYQISIFLNFQFAESWVIFSLHCFGHYLSDNLSSLNSDHLGLPTFCTFDSTFIIIQFVLQFQLISHHLAPR